MIVGCTKEIMNNECRVGITPSNASEYIAHGHKVIIETNAGRASGFSDKEYISAGAEIISTAKEV